MHCPYNVEHCPKVFKREFSDVFPSVVIVVVAVRAIESRAKVPAIVIVELCHEIVGETQ